MTGVRPRRDPARVRAWLALAMVVLLVGIYQAIDYTFLSAHLPPRRYEVLAPGAPASDKTADWRLLALHRTLYYGHDYDGNPGPTEAGGAVWIIADMEVTPRRPDDFYNCTFNLVGTDGRTWESNDFGALAEGESCAPDAEDVTLGQTYRFRVGYQVPEDEADHLAGLSLEPYDWHRWQLLRPPA